MVPSVWMRAPEDKVPIDICGIGTSAGPHGGRRRAAERAVRPVGCRNSAPAVDLLDLQADRVCEPYALAFVTTEAEISEIAQRIGKAIEAVHG
jgi:hypothetical protein